MQNTADERLKKLHIDYFNDFPLTMQGAESIHVYEICNFFQLLGNEVRLFSPITSNKLNNKFEYIKIQTPNFLKSVFYEILVIPKIIMHWRRQKPDVVYVRVTPILIIPTLLARMYRIPIYTEINGTIHPELQKANTKLSRILLTLHISDTVEALNYHFATKVITVTSSIKTYLVDRFKLTPSKVVVVENGVDADTLKPLPDRTNNGRLVVGYVGGLMWWQGINYIIEAMALALVHFPNMELVIYGDGPEKIALIEKANTLGIPNNVSFAGKITHDKVVEAINSFDISLAYYVKARDGLNSPFKVYEYLACGKPVIVSDIKGIGDTFKDVSTVVAAEDPAALSNAIILLANDKQLRVSMGTKARQYVVDGHTWRDTAKKLLDIM